MRLRNYSPSAYALAIFVALVLIVLWLVFCQMNLP